MKLHAPPARAAFGRYLLGGVALVGVVVLELIDSQVGRYTEHSLLAVGALALLVGMFFPQGLMGLLRGRFMLGLGPGALASR